MLITRLRVEHLENVVAGLSYGPLRATTFGDVRSGETSTLRCTCRRDAVANGFQYRDVEVAIAHIHDAIQVPSSFDPPETLSCRNQMHRLGQMQSYAGPMLSGERRFDVREMGYWRRIPGGSVFAQVYQQVCPDGQPLRAVEEPPPLQRLFGPR